VLTVGDSVRVVADFTATRDVLVAAVKSLRLSDDRTSLYSGLARAVEVGRTIDSQLPSRRAIVVLSDGLDDVFGGMSEQEVVEHIGTDRVPIYAIGLYQPPRTARKEAGLRILGNLARASGGGLERADLRPIAETYLTLEKRIREVLVAELACERCPRNGLVHRLQLAARVGGQTLTDGLDLRFLAPIAVRAEPKPGGPPSRVPAGRLWIAGLGGAALLGLVGAWAWYRARARKSEAPAAPSAYQDLTAPQPVAVQPVDGGPGNGPKGPRIRLTPLGLNSPGDARTFIINDRVLVGRSLSEADFPLPDDAEVSNVHCALIWQDPAIILKDLGSSNGTSVNGIPIRHEGRLEHNDVIRIGRSEVRLSILPNPR